MSTHRSAIPTPPDDCAKCPRLQNTRKKPVQSRGPDDAKVIVVGQAPGFQENVCGRPFVGQSGELLSTLLCHVAKIDPRNVRFTNVVRCYPGKDNGRDRTPDSTECSTCKENWLLPELSGLKNAKLVITLGGIAFNALTGMNIKELKWFHGIEIRPENASYTVFPTYHPSAPTAPGKFYIICKIIKDFAQLAGRW